MNIINSFPHPLVIRLISFLSFSSLPSVLMMCCPMSFLAKVLHSHKSDISLLSIFLFSTFLELKCWGWSLVPGYEWDIGHFCGAQRPEVECFKSTSFGLSDLETVDSDPLASVDKDNTDILMYCTGGIRCDVYSTILRRKGFKNLYTLKGGISHYLENEGPEQWIGNLFVFDSRLSLPPSTFKPGSTPSSGSQGTSTNKFARCYICGSQVDELRHRNCANLDCNRLFLCCGNCVDPMRGCCCSDCKSAPRLRPVLQGCTSYQKWHIYRDSKPEEASLGF